MSTKFLKKKLSNLRMIQFLGVGVINTVFGYIIYAVLIFASIPYPAALFAATIAEIIFNYFSFGRIVFYDRGGWFVFGKFAIVYAVIYDINAILRTALTKDLLLSPYLG